MNDIQLLKSFAEEASETAFRTLVERHLPLVLGTARRITGEPALAEEIAQAIFILLAKKARSFGPSTIVSGWLYRTTGFVAKRALVAEQRRRRREEKAVAMQINDDPDPLWQKMAPKLDKAMEGLGEVDRHALLLRFFENRSLREVGQTLGLNEEAAKKRVSRALEKLRQSLSRKGTEISTAALIVGMAHEGSAATVTADLASKIAAGAIAPMAAGTAAAGAATTLANEVLAAWRWATLKTASLAGLGLMVLILIIPPIARLTRARVGPQVASLPSEPPAPAAPIQVAANRAFEGDSIEFNGQLFPTHPLLIRVLDAVTGEPIPGAEITHAIQFELTPGKPPAPERTDASGAATLTIPLRWPGYERRDQFSVYVKAKEYASRTINWLSTTGCPLSIVSTQYTVRIESGITLSGTVIDERGHPLADVGVGALGNGYRGYTTTMDDHGRVTSPPEFRAEDFPEFHLDSSSPNAVTTDHNGRFELDHFPSDLRALVIDLVGPDGARRRYRTPQGDHLTVDEMPEVALPELRGGAARLVLPHGVTIEGAVADDDGNPITSATVALRGMQWGAMKELTRADADLGGRFWITNPPSRECLLVASAEGYASASTVIDPRRSSELLRLQLSAEHPLQGRVLNEAGQPVSQATVRTSDYLMSSEGLGFSWSANLDPDGRFIWRDAPTNQIPLTINAAGYASRLVYLRPATNDYAIVLRSKASSEAVHVTGKVSDAETGNPIEHFKVKISYTTSGDLPDRATRTVEGRGGQLDVNIAATEIRVGAALAWILQIEADGFETAATRVYNFAEGDQELELRLERGGTIEGTVLTPAGEPAVTAQLALPREGGALSSKGGEFSKRDLAGTSDSSGRFSLRKVLGGLGLLVFHDSGWAFIPLSPGPQNVNVQLLPWSRVEGTVRNGETPMAGEQVGLRKLTWNWSEAVAIHYSATSDSDGLFAFDKVPPGEYQVSVHSRGPWQRLVTDAVHALQTPVAVGIGETRNVTLSESGLPASARLRRPATLASLSWAGALATLSRDVTVPPEPAQGDYINNKSLANARLCYSQDPEVRAALRQMRSYVGSVNGDGTSLFNQVPPGHYILEVKLFAPKSNADSAARSGYQESNLAGHLRAAVSVPDAAGDAPALTPVQLGEFTLEPL